MLGVVSRSQDGCEHSTWQGPPNTRELGGAMYTNVQVSGFDRGDITNLGEQLTGVCIACGVGDECVDAELCPVDQALNVIDTYLRTGRQITRPSELPVGVPEEAWFDKDELRCVTDSISELCLRCELHVPTCFLNTVYGLIEKAQGIADAKPPRVALYLVAPST